MADTDSFIVDLRDPEDRRRKGHAARDEYAKAAAVYNRHMQVALESKATMDEWRELAVMLLGDEFDEAPAAEQAKRQEAEKRSASGAPSVADLVVEVVNREVRPIRAVQVRDTLRSEGHDVTSTSVSNALHYTANRAKRIKTAPGRGMYAPLAWRGFGSANDHGGQAQGVFTDAAA